MAKHVPNMAGGWEAVTASAEETVAKGRELAAQLHPPVVVLLSGELGSGKTTLAKGIISGLGAAREEEVTSPTFTLVHAFRSRPDGTEGQPFGLGPHDKQDAGATVYHVDLYRVDGFHDLETLGLEDVLAEAAVVIVEWPERLTLRVAWPVVRVRLEHLDGDRRRITVSEADEGIGLP